MYVKRIYTRVLKKIDIAHLSNVIFKLFIAGYFAILFLHIGGIIQFSHGQMENSADKIPPIKVYGCEEFNAGTMFYCSPIPNKFDSYEIGNVSSLIYGATNKQPLLVKSTQGLALELHGNHLESIEIPNKRDINPTTFSISFWVKSIQNPQPNGDILSHVNASLTSGWYLDSFKIQNSSD